MTVLFMLTIAGAALMRPDLAGEREPRAPLRERIARLADLTGPFVVFVIIMGSVYTGWATVTESAALSVIAALGIAAVNRTLSIRMLHDAFVATANLTAITMLILAVAFYLNFALGSLKIAESAVLHRPDPDAPVSPLYVFGRKQDLAFELDVGGSADQRHHVRWWRAEPRDAAEHLARDLGDGTVGRQGDPRLTAVRVL